MATAGEVYRAPVPAAAQELHVLAVDDSYVDRKVIERLLEKSSCKVTAVESGKRALQYLGLDGENSSSVDLNALKVNLIMTDYSMPGMTGYELLKRIKESSAFREIPVVIMSSENILTRIDRCLEEGAEEYILKPVKPADVKRIKDFVTRGEGQENGKARLGKRKLQGDNEPLSSSSTPRSFSPSAASPQSSSTSASCDTTSSQPSYSSSTPHSFLPSAACDTASSQAPSTSSSLNSSLKRPKYSN